MSELTTRSKLHKRICNFVDWIKPKSETRDNIKNRAKNIRKNISKKAEEKGVVVSSTPNAGSFATRTGLRRHYRGKSEVEGQDVDLPFVLEPKTVDGEKLEDLLSRFKSYATICYPDTTIKTTKSSVKLIFNDNVCFDLVPMLATENQEEQIIIRATGEKISTSVQNQVEFIRSRNRNSNEQKGRVRFNECVRLMKWWRDFQASSSYFLGGDETPPSFLINLLAAKAFDQLSVEETYAETLFRWFGYLAHVVENRKPILFTDYNNPKEDEICLWTVMDPVNPNNNVVKSWNQSKIDELGNWFALGRDHWSRIIRYDIDGEDAKSLEYLVILFGNPFKNHCDQ